MKITVFTSNQPRHIHLINSLAAISDECNAIMEVNTVFPGQVDDFYKKSSTMQKYFSHVIESEKKLFGEISFLNKSVNNMVIRNGDLNKLTKSMLDPALNADIYVVFGSSYIKGWLIEYLVENNALNIHMGMSPYYRGSSCNFWAIYDSNPHLMGATIHMLSKGLDSGEILYQVMPTTENCKNPFDFTMTSVLSAHKSIVQRIETKEIFDYEPTKQNRSLEIRYSKNSDFTDEIAKTFLDRKLSISEIQYLIDKNLNYTEYINPFKLT